MNRFYRSVFALGLIFILPLAAKAADSDAAKSKVSTPATPSADYSPVLKIFKGQGVAMNYLGRQFGLDGWLLTKDGKIQIIYITPDGQGAVVGTMYGPDGNLLTGAQLEAAKEKNLLPSSITDSIPPTAPASSPDASATQASAPMALSASPADTNNIQPRSEQLWKQVEASTYIKFGPDSAPPFYVIMDPRCHFCHDFYQTLRTKYLANNAIQLRVIPVDIIDAESTKQADRIVSSPDMTKSWEEIENYNIANLPQANAGAHAKIQKNDQIMEQWNMTGTPSCIYRSKDGKVKVVIGIPEDLAAVMADIAPGKP